MRKCLAVFLCCVIWNGCHKHVLDSSQILASYHLAAWSVNQSKMVGLVRAITPDSQKTPPKLLAGGRTITMTARANPDPAAFKVTVWEAVVDVGQSATLEGQPLPIIKNNPQKMVVLGDTGCYPNQNAKFPEWPYPTVVDTLTKQGVTPPDLVVHVGDYNYRGTPHHSPHRDSPDVYDACGTDYQKQDTKGMAYGDDWSTWELDFFAPARALLEASPWAIVRGNHELCSRAGTGWFYLLDPRSKLLDSNYEENPCQNANTYASPAYPLPFQSFQLIMVDSANLCDTSVEPAEQQTFTPIFQKAIQDAKGQQPSWFVTHKPLFSYNKAEGSAGQDHSVKVSTYTCGTMDAVLGQSSTSDWAQYFSLFLAGHVHQFQYVKPSTSGWPAMFVVGNSGVALRNSALNGPVNAHFHLDSGSFQATGSAHTSFGYLSIDLSSGSTQAALFDPKGNTKEKFSP